MPPVMRETRVFLKAGSSFEWDFNGNIVLGIVGLHIAAVLVSKLLKDLIEPRLVGDQSGARSQRLSASASQADGGCL